MKKLLAILLGLGISLALAGTALGDQPKVLVCKYVGTPGNETLQTGQNPIEVAVNAIVDENGEHQGAGVVPGYEFSDDQGRSVVVASEGDCTASEPSPSPTPTPTPTPSPTPVSVACSASVGFGPWYGDPRVNITLRGPGTFDVKGGIQRFSGTRHFHVSLGCNETFRISRYKVKFGHTVSVYLNGALFDLRTAPAVR